MEITYYIKGLLRQANAQYARDYLEIQAGGGTGTVTHTTTALTLGQVVVGNGADDIKVLPSPGDATMFLNGDAIPAFAHVKDSDLSLTDITTNNATTLAHGFLPKLSGVGTEFLNGLGLWATPAGGGITQLTGDVTAGPGSGSQVATIPNNTVTYAKMQDVTAASRLLGRGDSGAGDPEEISLGSGLVMTGTVLSATASSGINQLTGDVTAGPGTGSQVATIPANTVTYAKMQDVSAASRLLGRGSAGGAGDPEEITLGTNLTMVGTTLDAADFFYTRQDYWATPTGANTGGIAFNINSTGSAGTFVPPDANHPGEVPITTAGAFNSIAQWSSTTGGLTVIPYNRTMEYVTYITTIETVLFTYFVGLSNTTFGATDTPAGPCALFRFSTTAGDTNWRAYVNNGSGTDNIDTGVAYAANTTLKFELRWDGSTTNKVKFYINNTLVATSTIDFTSTQTFGIINYVITKANPGAKTLRYGGTRMRVTYF